MRSRRSLVASLAVALLVALALWLAWRRRAATTHPTAEAPVARDAAVFTPDVARVAPAHRAAGASAPVSPASASTAEDRAAIAGAFEGRVIAETDGRPVARAAISFVHEGATATVVTGTDGAFRFVPAREGRYDLVTVTAEGYLPFAPEFGHSPIALYARAGVRVGEITLTLAPSVEYTAVVLDPAGHPVEGARVRVVDGALDPAAGATPLLATDAHGEARFHAPDGAVLEARHLAFGPGRAALDFGAQVSRRLVIHLADRRDDTAPDGAIAGMVLTPGGEPADGALVTARMDEGDAIRTTASDLAPGGRAVTAPDGRFVIEDLGQGAYTVTASLAGVAPAVSEHVAVGTRDLSLRLSAGTMLRGVVRDQATQRPLAGFTLVVFPRRGPLEHGTAITASVFDAEGRYQITGLTPGPYDVTAVARGYAPAAELTVTLAEPGGPPAEADFALARGGRLTGRVVDARTSAPLQSARISVEGRLDPGASPLPILASTSTDAEGRFELTGLAPGLRSVMAAAEGHHGRILSGLRVEPDGDLGPLTIELTPTRPGEQPHLELAGIGAVLAARGDAMVIGMVLPTGGAAEAGLGVGDGILRVDGESVVTLGFEGSIQRIRGPEGSTVHLSVRRANDAGTIEIDVPRRRVQS